MSIYGLNERGLNFEPMNDIDISHEHLFHQLSQDENHRYGLQNRGMPISDCLKIGKVKINFRAFKALLFVFQNDPPPAKSKNEPLAPHYAILDMPPTMFINIIIDFKALIECLRIFPLWLLFFKKPKHIISKLFILNFKLFIPY